MKIQVEIPVTVYVDNVGAIWLSNNHTTSKRTKPVHIRTAFVKEYQEEGETLIKFVNQKTMMLISTPKIQQISHFKNIEENCMGKDEITKQRNSLKSSYQSTGRTSKIYLASPNCERNCEKCELSQNFDKRQ